MNQNRLKKKPSLIIIDTLEDKVKSRGVFLLVCLLLYIYITWAFLIRRVEVDKTPNNIEIALDFPHLVSIGTNISDYLIPQVRVLNSGGRGIPDLDVEIVVVKIATDTSRIV